MIHKCRSCGEYYHDGGTTTDTHALVYGICDNCLNLHYKKKCIVTNKIVSNNSIIVEEI